MAKKPPPEPVEEVAPRRKIWREALRRLGKKNPPEFTAEDVSKEFDLTYAGAAQLLKRLQSWGHIRLIAFDPPAGGGVGRRRKVYELTKHGVNAANYRGKD